MRTEIKRQKVAETLLAKKFRQRTETAGGREEFTGKRGKATEKR